MQKVTTISSRVIPLLVNNVDTDQIIPARFLKVTDKQGLAENLFADWRYADDGSARPEFVLNQSGYRGARILLVGDNFGCGSSREHAPWALTGFGIQAIISTSFGDIFASNALKNSLLPVRLAPAEHARLVELVRNTPDAVITVALDAQCVRMPDGEEYSFPIDPFSRTCLLNGVDELGYLLALEETIGAFERTHGGGARP
jgi:3-isopropylmalate/(R)-2-methylmalate dehydratase small subunit